MKLFKIYISKRAAIEHGVSGIGVSTRARKYWRTYWKNNHVESMLGDNKFINDVISSDAKSSQLMHRFLLKSGEVGEIRKSNTFYYLCVNRKSGQIDVIGIQATMKPVSEGIRQKRLTEEWLKNPKISPIRK